MISNGRTHSKRNQMIAIIIMKKIMFALILFNFVVYEMFIMIIKQRKQFISSSPHFDVRSRLHTIHTSHTLSNIMKRRSFFFFGLFRLKLHSIFKYIEMIFIVDVKRFKRVFVFRQSVGFSFTQLMSFCHRDNEMVWRERWQK